MDGSDNSLAFPWNLTKAFREKALRYRQFMNRHPEVLNILYNFLQILNRHSN
jgi:hypothetical protein